MTNPQAEKYQAPTPEEVRALLRAFDCTAQRAGNMLAARGRTAREWLGGTRALPYPHLYTLLHKLTREAVPELPLRVSIANWRAELEDWLQDMED